jgi:endonuclease/exonuclease/phosphatase family metal-dependent hydrolase
MLIIYFIIYFIIIITLWILYQKSYHIMYTPPKTKKNIKNSTKPSIITYNIQKFFWSCKNFDKIVKTLRRHSIILLQECYDESYGVLKTYFPDYYICREMMQGINIINSGLVILSKYPIYKKKFIPYKNFNMFSLDCLSEKGFLMTWIKVNNKKYCIVNTHLQSSKYNRYDNAIFLQLNELFNYIKRLKSIYIIGGDFNIDIKDITTKFKLNNNIIYNSNKPTIYIDFKTGNTQSNKKKGYEGLIFDYFITKTGDNIINNVRTIYSNYSDHNMVSAILDY